MCRKRNSRLLWEQFRELSISVKLRQPARRQEVPPVASDTASYRLRINGVERVIESSDPDQPLLYGLRGLGLTATKFGCGLGQCGACSVLIDDSPARSCLETIANVQGKSVVTLEGLGSLAAPHPVQAAFIKEQVPQCGYCTSGMIISAAALLAAKPKPTEDDVRAALAGNLCRCGTHVRVIRAVMSASGQGG
jgi:nicotinate dehydrogenase subunit A